MSPHARKLQFGLVLLPSAPGRLVETVRLAERQGFDLIGLGDSQSIARELHVSLAIAAGATHNVRIGPTVTNLQTRHPVVTASAIATLDELSGGRAFLGIGSGDSAVYSLGQKATPLRRLRKGIVATRALLAGETARWDEVNTSIRWSHSQAPILVTAEGPLTLQAAGELGDGVILGGGVDRHSITSSMELVEEGVARGGRQRSSLEVWSFVKLRIAPTRDAAIGPIKMSLAHAANHTFRHGFENKAVPDELIPRIEALRAAYAFRDHDQDDGRNVDLVDNFGLTDWLADRFAVVGPAEECITALERIAQSGVDGILITALFEDPNSFIEEFGQTVLRPFRKREHERLN